MRLLAVAAALAMAGCSVRPIPDDVSPIPTEEIVRSMRCETKLAVRDQIGRGLARLGLTEIVPDHVLEPKNLAQVRRRDKELGTKFADKFLAYGASAIAYQFDFSITERNELNGGVGFRLPFPKGVFDLAASGGLNKQREGKRVFKTVETFADLNILDCDKFIVREKNLTYPITGSIGMAKAIDTFVALTELGGGKEQFTDTLTFTTSINGALKPRVVLNPVPKTFRVVNAEATIAGSRVDVHKVTISFAFPKAASPGARRDGGETSTPQDRALENLCIARATDREDEAGQLRLYPPEIYCRKQSGRQP